MTDSTFDQTSDDSRGFLSICSITLNWRDVVFEPFDATPIAIDELDGAFIIDQQNRSVIGVRTASGRAFTKLRPGMVGRLKATELHCVSGKPAVQHVSGPVVIALRSRHGETNNYTLGTIVFVEISPWWPGLLRRLRSTLAVLRSIFAEIRHTPAEGTA